MYAVCLLISLLCLIELLSYADIIYLELDSTADNSIIYLKNGKQVKGRIVKQIPEQLIETSDESILAYQIRLDLRLVSQSDQDRPVSIYPEYLHPKLQLIG